MNGPKQICGRHYATQQPIGIWWHDGVITQVEPVSLAAASDLWLAPALCDLQVNGYGGVDFQQDNLTISELLSVVRQLNAAGCGRFLLTLITDEWPKLMARLQHLRRLRSQSPQLQRAIAGWHIEGPFLSSESGFHGAHDPHYMLDPAAAHIEELRALTGNDPVLLTLSPERQGSLEAIRLAVAKGIKISLGHTNASDERLREAVEAGATGFTHLGNGCPQALDRHDNILWRVLDSPRLRVSFIPDRIHVSPPFFRLAHRLLSPESIYYVSDAMAAAGAPPGRYKLGPRELEVGPDQVVRQPGSPLLAGSALRPIDGVVRAAEMLGCSWQETWTCFSGAPAKFMDLRSGLIEGAPSDICVVKEAASGLVAQLLDP